MEQKDIKFANEVLPFWDALSDNERTILLNRMSKLYYSKGQIIHSGDDCTGLLLVRSGQVRTYILSESGKEITLFRLFDRDVCILSSSCMMKNITFDVQVEAEKDSEMLLIPTAVYQKLSDTNMAVKDFTNEIISSRLSDVMWVMEQVVFMSLDKRLANFLLDQYSIQGTDQLLITHETIARNIGSAREVVTRMLKYFQNESMVLLSRGMITLIDRKKLNSLL